MKLPEAYKQARYGDTIIHDDGRSFIRTDYFSEDVMDLRLSHKEIWVEDAWHVRCFEDDILAEVLS